MTGRILPESPTTAGLLGAALPRRHRAHAVARAAQTSVDTARSWISKRFVPSADTLLRIARHNRAVRLELIRVLEEIERADMAALGTVDGDGVGARECAAVGEDGAVFRHRAHPAAGPGDAGTAVTRAAGGRR